MDMKAASSLLSRQTPGQVIDGVRIADTPVLLAVLSVQQAAGFTATRMREERPIGDVGDEPSRMAVIFAPPVVRPALPKGMAGAFNAFVAAQLSMGTEGENDVYSGA